MRIFRLDITEEFRAIRRQHLPADGLVVLFGPNSAGKTSVLEAAGALIGRSPARFRSDPGDPEWLFPDGAVWFDFPAADVRGSADYEIFRALLCGKHAEGRPWGWLDPETAELLKGADVEQACSYLVSCLVGAGSAGVRADRELLARSFFDPTLAVFVSGSDQTLLVAISQRLPREVLTAARRIAGADGDDDDALREIAKDLASKRRAVVCGLADSLSEDKALAAALPPVIWLDGDPESLSHDLREALQAIHDRLWDSLPARKDEPGTADPADDHGGQRIDVFLLGWSAQPSGDQYSVDPWLEGQSETGATEVASIFSPYRESDWYRVRHSILAAAHVIEEEANRVAPSFVSDQGRIGIEVLPVSVWGSVPHRVRATFTEHGAEEARDLRVTGAGTARWVASAIRLACRRLEVGEQVVTDESGMRVNDPETAETIIKDRQDTPLDQAQVRLQPADAPAVYLVDEPEEHLHPAAVVSVRDWLTRLAETAASVFVATHSPILLNSDSQLIRRVLVRRGPGGTELRLLTGGLADDLADVSGEIGLTEGDLLLMMRLALFVEGPHDKIVLEELFGDELRKAGIRIFPVHSVDHLPQIVESEVIAALGTRMAALSDRPGRPHGREGQAMAKLLDEAKRLGKQVMALSLSEPDILYYLDEQVCREIALDFPGWAAAFSEFRAARKAGTARDWKDWVADKYSLPLRPRENIQRLARKCAEQGSRPPELTRLVQNLIAHATAPKAD